VLRLRRLWLLAVGVVGCVLASLPVAGGSAGSLPPGVSASDIPPVCTATTNPNYCIQRTSYGNLSISPHFVVPGSVVTGTITAAARSSHCGCEYAWGDEPGTGTTFVDTFAAGTQVAGVVSGCRPTDTTCSVRVPVTTAPNGKCCETVAVPISTPQGAVSASDWFMFVKAGSVTTTSTATTTTTKKPPPRSRLKVLVTVPKKIRSGLGVHDLYGHPEPQSLVDFAERKPSTGLGGQSFQCESGCADVLVTVRDPRTNDAVEGSRVAVRVTTLTGAPGGREYICGTDPDTGRTMGFGDCGLGDLSDLRTDSSGQVHLRYWIPGVVETTPVTLQVTAAGGTCTPHPCSRGVQPGLSDQNLTLEPYMIYKHTAPLSEHDIQELSDWAGGPSIFHLFLSGSTWGEKAVASHLKWLVHEELATEKEIELLEHLHSVPVKVLSYGIEAYNTWTELSEHWAMIGLFLENTELSGAGLGNDPFEESAPAYPTYPFTKQLANYNGLAPGNIGEAVGLGESGAWWDIATTMRKLVTGKDPSVQPGRADPWSLQIKVYEISHCDPHGQCDPGYTGDHGIQAELYFRIALLYNDEASPGGAGLYLVTTQYDPIAWAEAQQARGADHGRILGLLHS
jgi:hypothetical protein